MEHNENLLLHPSPDAIDESFKGVATLLSEEMMKSMPASSFAVENKQQKQRKLELEIIEKLAVLQQRVAIGASQLIEEYLDMAKNSPPEEVEAVLYDLGQFQRKGDGEELDAALHEGKSLAEYYVISDLTLEVLYQAAKRLYDKQAFKASSGAFYILAMLSSKTASFWMGVGASEQLLQNYEQALVAYAAAAFADPFDSVCHLYAAKCYQAIGDTMNAVNSLKLALIAAIEEKGTDGFTALEQYVQEETAKIHNTK